MCMGPSMHRSVPLERLKSRHRFLRAHDPATPGLAHDCVGRPLRLPSVAHAVYLLVSSRDTNLLIITSKAFLRAGGRWPAR